MTIFAEVKDDVGGISKSRLVEAGKPLPQEDK
jgi:hypothetical protein